MCNEMREKLVECYGRKQMLGRNYASRDNHLRWYCVCWGVNQGRGWEREMNASIYTDSPLRTGSEECLPAPAEDSEAGSAALSRCGLLRCWDIKGPLAGAGETEEAVPGRPEKNQRIKL